MEAAASAKRGRPSAGARQAVLDAARDLFIERDYDRVSTTDIHRRAGVSRGALYHHFDSKRALYRAVWHDSEARLIGRLAAAGATADTPFGALVAGCLAYLDEAAWNRELVRIGLLQSRSVLGWEEWREGIADFGMAAMRAAVDAAVVSREIRDTDSEATGHVILAALIEAALLIATADDSAVARGRVEPPFVAMLEGLRR